MSLSSYKILSLSVTALATAVMATGCVDDKDTSMSPDMPLSRPIMFDNAFVDNMTRAATVSTTDNLESFKVYGFVDTPASVVFDNATVRKSKTGRWTANKTEYWYPDHVYRFTGIAPSDATAGWAFSPVTADTGSYYGGGTLTFDIKNHYGQTDLLYAFSGAIVSPAVIPSSPAPVELDFKHMLSQVKFTYINELGNHHYFVNVSLTQLRNVCGKATIDMNSEAPEWKQKDYSTAWINLDGVLVRTDAPSTTPPVFLIPESIPGTEVHIQSQVFYTPADTGTQGYVFSDMTSQTVKLPEVDFKPGYTYNFIAHITADNVMGDHDKLHPIIFTVTESPRWDNIITIETK